MGQNNTHQKRLLLARGAVAGGNTLRAMHHIQIATRIVRGWTVENAASAVRQHQIVGKIRRFDATSSGLLRWAIANTLAEAKPTVSDDWLAERLQTPDLGIARQMLTMALARMTTPDFAIPILRNVFDDLPGFVAMAFAEIGGLEEIELLSQNRSGQKTYVRKEIDKAIRKIERRSKKNRKTQ